MKNSWKQILGIVFLSSFLALVGCSSKKKEAGATDEAMSSTTDSAATAAGSSELNINGDSDNRTAGSLTTVFFDFDSSTLRQDTKAALDANHAFLTANTNVEIQIEGHCDERGAIEYNLALGERRANSAKKYLVSLGIPESRISTISYGKERPLDPAHNEEAWAKNRRAHTIVLSK